MPKPVLTRHVKLRMEEREISEWEIYTALAREFRRAAASSGKIWVYGYLPGGRILKVALTPDQTTILTAARPDE